MKMKLKLPLDRIVLSVATSAILGLGKALPTFARPAFLTARESTSQINVRSGPSTLHDALHHGLVGDRVDILREIRGSNGYIWYYVQFQRNGVQGWIREDLVQRVDTAPETVSRDHLSFEMAAQSFLTPDSSEGLSDDLAELADAGDSPEINSKGFTTEQIDYFFEVALGIEFGANTSRVRKWEGPIRIRVHGRPTDADLIALQRVTEDIERLTRLDIRLNASDPNLEIYFVPESEFHRYEPNYRPLNYGFFWTWWNNYTIEQARILISTVEVNQQERSHLLREELTQSLGLMADSNRYQDSIFYQGWTSTAEYSSLDRVLLQMLYLPRIRPGMTRAEVMAELFEFSG
ncbi:MAG: DUF2927 domain-containing protein [Leptolyngbyaceae cyanobacterium MO_188.B28]|nr:DUF2927 domain-containing protein [Leptolyngbyaceae cyanobacterium MO_188.B28]